METSPQDRERDLTMNNPELIRAARTTPVTHLTDTEAMLDMKKLRGYRLGRLRAELVHRDYGACVLFDPISIRYATGYRNLPVLQMHIPGTYVFVPANGPVVLFEAELSHHVAAGLETIDECRPALPQHYFIGGDRMDEWVVGHAREIAELVREHCGGNRRLAVTRTDVRAPAAFAAHHLELFDAVEVLERARSIKSPEEILCMNVAIGVAEVGMARMREALRPGMTDAALWSILHQTNISMGGEWIDCRLLASGDRAVPWMQETSQRMIRPCELVAFDTDMIGPLGYAADISRTFFSGPGRPKKSQRDVYRLAHEEVHHNLELVKAGVTFGELSERSFRQPPEYVANRYLAMAHGIGMCDEWPTIYYPLDHEKFGYDGVLEEGMTLSVESFMGAVGGHEGVKLEQQVLVTGDGYELLSHFPFEEELLN